MQEPSCLVNRTQRTTMMNADDGPPISHWTRFRPKPECLPTISSQSEDGKKWKEIMRPLLLAPGHIRTHWGPVIEEEGDWILVTGIALFLE